MRRQLPRPSMFRRVLLALWGMATLILFFTVILLANEMAQRGQNPLTIVTENAPPPKRAETVSLGVDSREVFIYFGSDDGLNLVPERRRINFTGSTAENCRNAIEEIIEGPSEKLTAIVPSDTNIHAAYLLDDGSLIVDFTRNLLFGALKSVSSEGLMIYGIVNTVAQTSLQGADGKTVRSVQFLIENSLPPEGFPAHFDLSKPIEPDARWNQAAETVPLENA